MLNLLKLFDYVKINRDCMMCFFQSLKNINRYLNVHIEKFLLVLMLILCFIFGLNQFFDHDEFEAIHTAWKLMHGQVMFVDFFQQKPPFFHFTLIPFIKFFSESVNAIFACKFYMFILFLTLIYFSYFISIKVFGRKTRFITPIILMSCTFYVDKLTEIRPDVLYMSLSMFAIAILFKKLRLDNKSLVFAGFLFGLSFAVLPKAAIYILPMSFLLLIRLFLKKISLKGLFLYFFAMALTVIPFFVFMLRTISLQDYYFFNFLMNFKFLGTFSPFTQLEIFIRGNLLFLILAIPGFFCLKHYRQKEVGFLAIVLFLSLFTINVPNRQYILPAVPFVAMICANFISSVKLLKHFMCVILLLIVYGQIKYFIEETHKPAQKYQIEQIQFVLDNTAPDDKVYDGSIYFNVYRDDVNYFWFSVRENGVVDTYKSMRPAQYDIYKDIEVKKPKIIYLKYLDKNHPLIKKYYMPVRKFCRLYIRRDKSE